MLRSCRKRQDVRPNDREPTATVDSPLLECCSGVGQYPLLLQLVCGIVLRCLAAWTADNVLEPMDSLGADCENKNGLVF